MVKVYLTTGCGFGFPVGMTLHFYEKDEPKNMNGGVVALHFIGDAHSSHGRPYAGSVSEIDHNFVEQLRYFADKLEARLKEVKDAAKEG